MQQQQSFVYATTTIFCICNNNNLLYMQQQQSFVYASSYINKKHRFTLIKKIQYLQQDVELTLFL